MLPVEKQSRTKAAIYLYLNHGVTTNPDRRHGSVADFGLGCPQGHMTICNVDMSQNIYR
jgi:hypothetical protein